VLEGNNLTLALGVYPLNLRGGTAGTFNEETIRLIRRGLDLLRDKRLILFLFLFFLRVCLFFLGVFLFLFLFLFKSSCFLEIMAGR
jgi:hypothetical protein